MEALWSRFLEHWLKLPELIQPLGQIKSIQADFSVEISHVKRLTELELGGGALLDLGVYPLSFIQMLLGKAQEINVSGEVSGGVDKNLSAELTYPDSIAHFTTGFDSDGDVKARVVCERGEVEIDSRFYEQAEMRVIDDSGQVRKITPNHQGRGMQEQFIRFEQAVEEGRLEVENFTQRDSLDVLEMMDNIRNQLGVIYPGE
jgi:predicted dehydrogenase